MVSRAFVLSIAGVVILIPAALVIAIKAYQPDSDTPVRGTKVATQARPKPAEEMWGCKASDNECKSMAEKAEAEYQAQGGDAHVKAENEAFTKPEALAANEYYGKFLTAKRSGATAAELCSLLIVAHMGYAEAGATDEVKRTQDWQTHYGCR